MQFKKAKTMAVREAQLKRQAFDQLLGAYAHRQESFDAEQKVKNTL